MSSICSISTLLLLICLCVCFCIFVVVDFVQSDEYARWQTARAEKKKQEKKRREEEKRKRDEEKKKQEEERKQKEEEKIMIKREKEATLLRKRLAEIERDGVSQSFEMVVETPIKIVSLPSTQNSKPLESVAPLASEEN
jgi:lipopolysaccharide export LptBFGC system permease protein LptF